MFTGIVESIGKVQSIIDSPEDTTRCLGIETSLPISEVRQGDSISINGACLTVTNLCANIFTVDITNETLKRTNLGDLIISSSVNLERSLAFNSRLGGHILQGHIDTIGKITSFKEEGNSSIISVSIPRKLIQYVVEKGFIAIDGISLTPIKIRDSSFTVSVIPYTMSNTILNTKNIGDYVNIEVDILAKYIESLLHTRSGD